MKEEQKKKEEQKEETLWEKIKKRMTLDRFDMFED